MWLGDEFAGDSGLVLQLLAFGVFVNSLAHVPLGLVQGAGRPDLTARLHLAELPFYLLLWRLLGAYGIVGVAIAWVIRVCVDGVVLFVMVGRFLLSSSAPLRSFLVMGLASSMLLPAAIISGLVIKPGLLIVVLSVFSVLSWFVILAPGERGVIKGFINVKH
ncbi:MAG: hypothetical protein KAI17_18710 [Thiotrichaceae bacterium]|nr:hypothetical protein [Thiotrichaceae bacterium]